MSILPHPSSLKSHSSVQHLKIRLDWGEPALTIVDIRDRPQFNSRHITGAVSMPMGRLIPQALASLELSRDLYVYGETDEESTVAAAQLREAGFQNVAVLRGGLAAWDAFKFPVEESNLARS